MDNIQFEVKEKSIDTIELTETNKKVTFNNKVQIKTIPNNDQNKQSSQIYNEIINLQSIYGDNLEEEKKNQEKILADIKRRKQIEYFRNLNMQLANMKR